MSLIDGEWLSSIEYLQNNVDPAQNKTNDIYTSLKPRGIKQETLLSQIAAVCKYIYQQQIITIVANLTIQNLVKLPMIRERPWWP
jgi:hypothetical protein